MDTIPPTTQAPPPGSAILHALARPFTWFGGFVARRWRLLLAIAVACALVAILALAAERSYLMADRIAPSLTGDAERGRKLAVASDCAACHTAQGGAPFAGGLAMQTPFGVIYSSNITPDAQTGIGKPALTDVARVLRQGVGVNGQLLYPAMPYNHYTAFSDQDVADLRSYLATLTPVRHAVDGNALPFPFNIRMLMAGWDLLFFSEGRYIPDPARSAQWNRGAELVIGAGHCGSCHTAKNFLGGDSHNTLGGGVLNGWFAPAITNSQSEGLAAWSTDDIASYLATGTNGREIAAGPMDEVVRKSTSLMPPADLMAIAVYLKSLPGHEGNAQTAISMMDKPMAQGRSVFDENCAGCHRIQGGGAAGLIPALSANKAILSHEPATVLTAVLGGLKPAPWDAGSHRVTMPAFADRLSDDEVAAVTTYVRNMAGNAAPQVTARQVARMRQTLSSGAPK